MLNETNKTNKNNSVVETEREINSCKNKVKDVRSIVGVAFGAPLLAVKLINMKTSEVLWDDLEISGDIFDLEKELE